MSNLFTLYTYIVANISFNESSVYSVDENAQKVQLALVLSNQLPTDITVQVKDISNTAIG